MEQMSLELVRQAPERLEPFLKNGETVRITKGGEPFFDAVPIANGDRVDAFFRRLENIWATSGIDRSTDDLVSALRESRE